MSASTHTQETGRLASTVSLGDTGEGTARLRPPWRGPPPTNNRARPRPLTAVLAVQRPCQPGRLAVQHGGQTPQLTVETLDRVHAEGR